MRCPFSQTIAGADYTPYLPFALEASCGEERSIFIEAARLCRRGDADGGLIELVDDVSG